MMRRVAYLLSAALVVWAAIDVPMPFVETVPGSATSIAPLIHLDTEVTPVTGELALLTIRNRQPGVAETVAAWVDPDRELVRTQQVIPPGTDREEYFRLQQRSFDRASRIAVAVGLRAAGLETDVSTRPVVFSVLPDGPSQGRLEPGDVILAAQGTEVRSGEELIDQLRDIELGDPVTLEVQRDGERLTVELTAGSVPGLERPGIGIAIETIANDVELPIDVTIDETGIGGPSAGMMIALTVYDLVSTEDLTRGRRIAGSGTIDAEGNVGGIGGLEQKLAAAAEAGAELVLVPAHQVDEARGHAPAGLEVVGVATLDEAIEALRR